MAETHPRPAAWSLRATRLTRALPLPLLLGAITLVALLLRFNGIDAQTIGHPEMAVPGIELPERLAVPGPRLTLRQTIVDLFVVQEPHPPGYYLLMLVWTKLFGAGIVSLRLPSLLFGTGSVLLLYGLGRVLAREKAGLLAAALLALNGFNIFWSQTAQKYMMGLFLALLATVLLLALLRGARAGRALAAGYAVATWGALGTVVFAWPIFAAQVLGALLWRGAEGTRRALLRLQLGVALIGFPLLSLALYQSRRDSYVPLELGRGLLDYLQFGFLFEADIFGLVTREIPIALQLGIAGLVVALLAIGAWAERRERISRQDGAGVPEPASWLLALAAVAASLAIVRLGRFTAGFGDPGYTQLVYLSALGPPLLFVAAEMLLRLGTRLPLPRPTVPVVTTLAVVPPLLILLVSPVVSLFASRGVLLYVPYLLLLLSIGLLHLLRRDARWWALAALVLAVQIGGIWFNQRRVVEPVDYRTLATRLEATIEPGDVLVIQRHWAMTPILYYLPYDEHDYVWEAYAPSIAAATGRRVWQIEVEELAPPVEARDALAGYEPVETVEARRIIATRLESPEQQGALTHDPEGTLLTYLGGSARDSVRDVAVDGEGIIYVTGDTNSGDFPTTSGAYDTSFNGRFDGFVSAIGPDGSLRWSTYFGGEGTDLPLALELDPEGNILIAGQAGPGLPTTEGVVQPTFGGDTAPKGYGPQDGFVAKFSPDGALLWSTFFGSDDPSFIRDIAVGADGSIFGAMSEVSRDSPHITPGAFQTTRPSDGPGDDDPPDSLVFKLSPDGARVEWATYLGGRGGDGWNPSIRLDPEGRPVVLTHTQSDQMPVTGDAVSSALDLGRPSGNNDLYVARLSADGATLLYGSYLGGSGIEFLETHELAIDGEGHVIAAAITRSEDFPTTPGVFQPRYGGTGNQDSGLRSNYPGDAFVARFAPDGSRLTAATYVGGPLGEGGEGVAVDRAGNIWLTGASFSQLFPVSDGTFQERNRGEADAFLVRLSPDLTRLDYGTLVGGSRIDFGRAIFVDERGAVYITGESQSSDLPVARAAQPQNNGGERDGFVLRLTFDAPSTPAPDTDALRPDVGAMIMDRLEQALERLVAVIERGRSIVARHSPRSTS